MTDTQKNAAVEALKPCPFCGGDAFVSSGRMTVGCYVCGAEMHNGKDGYGECVTAWNQRASLPTTEQSLAGEAGQVSDADIAVADKLARRMGGRFVRNDQPAPVTGGEDAVEIIRDLLGLGNDLGAVDRATAFLAALSPSAPEAQSEQEALTPAEIAAINRIEARFHPHYGIDGATESKQLADDCRTLITRARKVGGAS